MNFSSSNKNVLNESFLVGFDFTLTTFFDTGCTVATGEDWTGAVITGAITSSSSSGCKATPTPVSDGMKSGGGNLGSRYGAEK